MKRRDLALALLLAIAAACGDSTSVPVVSQVVVSPQTATITALQDTTRFTAIAKDQNGSTIAGKAFTWSTSNPLVATVINASAGLVRAVDNGSADVLATADGIQGSALLNVVQTAGGMSAVRGNAQSGELGSALPDSLVVLVSDSASGYTIRGDIHD